LREFCSIRLFQAETGHDCGGARQYGRRSEVDGLPNTRY